MNRNWPLVRDVSGGALPMGRTAALELLAKVEFRPRAAFSRRYYGKAGKGTPPIGKAKASPYGSADVPDRGQGWWGRLARRSSPRTGAENRK